MPDRSKTAWGLLILSGGLGILAWLWIDSLDFRSKEQHLKDQCVSLLEDSLLSPNAFVRAATAKAISDSAHPQVLPLLKMAITDPDPTVRLFAIEGVVSLSPSEAHELLLLGMEDPDSSVRLTTVRIIHERSRRPEEKIALQALLKRSRQDQDISVHLAALGALGSSEAHKTMKVLEGALLMKKDEIRLSAAFALGLTQDQGAIKLLDTAVSDPSASVRAYAVRALGQLGFKKGFPSIKKALSDPDPQVRSFAAEALVKLSSPEVRPLLQRTASDPDDFVKLSVGLGLARLEESSSKDLIKLALSHPDYSLRSAAARSLGKLVMDQPNAFSQTEAIKLLLPIIKDEVSRVRSAAIRAVGMIGTSDQIPALSLAFTDPAPTVRPYAAGAVLRILSREGITALPELSEQ